MYLYLKNYMKIIQIIIYYIRLYLNDNVIVKFKHLTPFCHTRRACFTSYGGSSVFACNPPHPIRPSLRVDYTKASTYPVLSPQNLYLQFTKTYYRAYYLPTIFSQIYFVESAIDNISLFIQKSIIL